MNVRTILELRDRAPFRPFTLHLTDGRALRVQHPDFVSPSPKGGELVVWGSDGSLNVVDVDQITSIGLPKRNGIGR